MSDQGHPQSDEAFKRFGIEPLFRWLVVAALTGDVMYYGQVADRLEREAGFAHIPVSRRMGVLAGLLQTRLIEADSSAPLLNLLLVSSDTKLPGNKAGEIMARRERKPRLAEPGFVDRHQEEWRGLVARYTAEVRRYSAEDWAALHVKAEWWDDLSASEIRADVDARFAIRSDDGAIGGAAGGEGPYHAALRAWLIEDPTRLSRRFRGASGETEVPLLSGDRVDAVYRHPEVTVVVEAKSRISDEADHLRGVYQCVKYRAVLAAMELHLGPPIEAWLVTENPLSPTVRTLVDQHGIRHVQAPMDRT